MGNNNQTETMKWKRLSGVVTPGGDPFYICPNCREKDSGHLNGIESRKNWNYCPCCGQELRYY